MTNAEAQNILTDAKRIVAACEKRGMIKRHFANIGSYVEKKDARIFTPEHREKIRQARLKQVDVKNAEKL